MLGIVSSLAHFVFNDTWSGDYVGNVNQVIFISNVIIYFAVREIHKYSENVLWFNFPWIMFYVKFSDVFLWYLLTLGFFLCETNS